MKIIKCISLFFIYPCIVLCLGIFIGMNLRQYFYPGKNQSKILPQKVQLTTESRTEHTEFQVALQKEEILTADTDYVIEEYDVKRESLVETVLKVPEKYMGMDRVEFENCMDLYALSPPLSELERGFIGLEVRSFSSDKVVIRMNYVYTQPTKGFYLRVENNSIVVYCDDGETVYMYTDISAESLPEYIQGQIISGMYMEDEANMYHFLETYSS